MTDDSISIKIKYMKTSQTYDATIKKSQNVGELKAEIEKLCQVPVDAQNLVYKGRILQNDQTIGSYNIDNTHTIILVRKANVNTSSQNTQPQPQTQTQTQNTQSTGQPSAQTTGQSGNPFGSQPFGANPYANPQFGSQMAEMMNNPMVTQMMNQLLQDPNSMRMLLENPLIQPALNNNPQLREMLNNPELMRTIMNPQVMQSAMQMLQNNPNMLSGLGGNPFINPNMGMGFGNPYGNGGFQQGQSSGGVPNQGTSQKTDEELKTEYKTQLEQLKEMGYINEDVNFQVLKSCNGNVQLAIERLLNMFQ